MQQAAEVRIGNHSISHLFILRERYLNFLCSLELGEDVSKATMVKLFRNNLGKAEMLRYVHVFNIPHWSEELQFVFGHQDQDQWKVGPASKITFRIFATILLSAIMLDSSYFRGETRALLVSP